jgi:anti-sigma regulatory factor (Ser/Thr protein kinase)
MGLYNYLGIESPDHIESHDAAGRFIPLTTITTSTELSNFLNDVIPILHLPPEQARSIRYILSELVRNVLEHSFSTDGAIVAVQYYKKTNTIRIGIVDSGIGILSSMSDAYHPTNDLQAIKYALMPGVTGTTRREGGTDYNAGAGLFFIKSIASINEDLLLIYSGSAMYKLLKNSRKRLYADPDRDNHSEKTELPYWQGTVVGIDINLNSNEAFTTLLKLIQDTYSEAVKERRKERYRRAQFI